MMTPTPRISKGLGKLTPETWGRIMDTVEVVEGRAGPSSMAQDVARVFLARITSATAVNASVDPEHADYDDFKYMWQYGYEEVIPTWRTGDFPAATSSTMSDGETGAASTDITLATCAFNIVELANTADLAGPGVALSDSIYPEHVDSGTLVMMYQYWDPSGDSDNQNMFSLFTQDNPFTCQEGAVAPLASRTFNLDLGTFVSSSLAGSTIDFGAFT